MKNLTLILTTISLFAFSSASLHAESREWTQAASGKKISGEYAGLKDDATVTIKMANGKSFHVPLASLSKEDNDFVKAQMAGGGEGDKPATPATEGDKPAALPEGEVTLTLTDVHMCCKDCEEAVAKAKENDKVAVDEAVEIEGDRSSNSIKVTAPNGKAMQAALRAIVGSGFYGVSDHETLKIPALEDAGIETNTMTIRDVHLCCGGCTREVKKALKSVDAEADVEEGSTRFVVTGENLNPFNVITALRAAGFGGSFQ